MNKKFECNQKRERAFIDTNHRYNHCPQWANMNNTFHIPFSVRSFLTEMKFT